MIANRLIYSIILICVFSISIFAQSKTTNFILFKNVKSFDGVNEKLITGKDVLVEKNLIKEIASNIKAPEGAMVIDGSGKTLMPGLIDSHVHFNVVLEGGLANIEAARWDYIGALAVHSAVEWLVDGFTTVRDMGGLGNGLKKAVDAILV
jgi:imidazolonepropionase-like amidohydrolase